MPLCPVRIKLVVGSGKPVTFWWSQVLPGFDATKRVLEYRGPDNEELTFLARVLKPGMCFFDVGGYHGIYAVLAGRLLGRQDRIVVFEPSARERRRIRLNCSLNGVRAAIEPFAIGAARQESELFVVTRGYTTMNSLRRPSTVYPVRKAPVVSISLDEYCRENGVERIDVMKVDIEGGELEAFVGARWVLSEPRPLIICEVVDSVTRPWGYPARRIVRRVADFDCEWFEFAGGGMLSAHSERDEYPEVKNYLAVPREKRELVRDLVTPSVQERHGHECAERDPQAGRERS